MRGMGRCVLTAVLVWWGGGGAWAENYEVRGGMGARIHYRLSQHVNVQPGIQRLLMSFVVPGSFQSPTFLQEIEDFNLRFSTNPDQRERRRDRRGNDLITATWERPPRRVNVEVSFTAGNETRLKGLEAPDPYPLSPVPEAVRDYLEPTAQVQSDDPRVRRLAVRNARGARTQFDVVQQQIIWVVDHLRYVNPPERYDALYALESGRGNCQNFSHLSAALLRACGIPVRIVNGFTLDKPFDVVRDQGVLTFKMGKGRHSWVEVWFPSLGWVPFDPQRTEMFVSNRFIRVEIGADNQETIKDGLIQWARVRGTHARPSLVERIDADFAHDRVQVVGRRQDYGPRGLLLCPRVEGAAAREVARPSPPPPPKQHRRPAPPKERKRPAPPKPARFRSPFLYGNLEFPEDVDFSFARGPAVASGGDRFRMTRNFLVETAEYVTGKMKQYAQVFRLKGPVKLQSIGLALHRFGGNGQLWVEVRADQGGAPGKTLYTSDIISLESLSTRPGYRWVDFDFSTESPVLPEGDYWIALGYTGSPVVNWFYTYGKPVGPAEGTRYRDVFEKGWKKALSYEFNYRIRGVGPG